MSQNPLDEWTPPFDREWNQKEAAAYLTDNRNGPVFDPYGPLTSRITEAVLAGKLVADKREVPYKPSAFDTVFKIRYGRMDPKDLPATETEYRIKPIDAIRWALDAGINVRPECIDWYLERTKPGKRGPKPGSRDKSVSLVIVGLALANGWKLEGNARQGFFKSVNTALERYGRTIDRKTLDTVVSNALASIYDDG